MFNAIIIRDSLFYIRRKTEIFFPLLFYVMVTSLFAITFPGDPTRLASLAPMILWVAAVFAILLSIDSSYRSDLQDGTLEQIIVHSRSLTRSLVPMILGRTLAHWLYNGLPLILIAPIIALSMNVSLEGILAVLISFAIGIPAVSLLATLGVALTISLHRGGVFLSILMLPLIMPVLLLGVGTVSMANLGLNWTGHIALLLAILILSVTALPWVIAAALRINIQ